MSEDVWFDTDAFEVEWLDGRRMPAVLHVWNCHGNKVSMHMPTSMVADLARELAKSEIMARKR